VVLAKVQARFNGSGRWVWPCCLNARYTGK
jgi:hypothetical protein